jgi:two-component system, cell cycle sensor histidine kinase and response regulator CckA
MTPKNASSGEIRVNHVPSDRPAPGQSGRFAILGGHADLPDGLLAPFLDQDPSPVFCASRDGILVHANVAGASLLAHWSLAPGQPLPPELRSAVRAAVVSNVRQAVDLAVGGQQYSFAIAPVPGTRWAALFGSDVTERRRIEEQLRQAEKMDAVGRLAGGVVHDFGNTLSVILSYSGLLLSDLAPDHPMRKDLEEIRNAGTRATRLIRQLLSFSRQQVLDPHVLDLNEIVRGMHKMLERVVGEDVRLVTRTAADLGTACVDAAHIEQVIVNLVVNARDAMPAGGRLTVETSNAEVRETDAHDPGAVAPGRYVVLSVTDTGIGMDAATRARIFEPFFTTKEKGKGTGLGLSTVFGIVQQSGGSVRVASTVGRGTTFHVYLPRVDEPVHVARPTLIPATLRGSETVLLVEDEESVRAVSQAILQRNGYRVIVASNAHEALVACETYDGIIHMLLTDVVMPEMGGADLAARIHQARPATKVLFMSGYTDEGIARLGILKPGVAFLQKPITPKTMARKVREVLDAP